MITLREAVRRYCEIVVQLTSGLLPSPVEHLLDEELETLADVVHQPAKDVKDEQWRQKALTELLVYLMGEDIPLTGLEV